MLIGVPGSGKSTWVKKQWENDEQGNPIVKFYLISTDGYIESVAKASNKTYNDVFQDAFKDAEKFMNSNLSIALERQSDIVWDQTNVTKKSRAKKLAKIPKYYRKIALLFQVDYDTLIKVNNERKKIGRSIPYNILQSMYNTIEAPTLDEGFDEIIKVERE